MKTKKLISGIALIAVFSVAFGFQTSSKHKVLFEKAKFTMETKGDLKSAIKLFNEIIKKYPKEREYGAKALLHIGLCNEKLGKQEAQRAYQRIIQEYGDQKEVVTEARTRLSSLRLIASAVQTEDIVIRKVMDGTGAGFVHGAPSPDGKYFSFVDWGPYPNDIVIKEIGTGEEIRLRNQTDLNYEGDVGTPYAPIWSPDSKKIAYTWENNKAQYNDLRVIEIGNSEPDVLIRVSFRERNGWVQAEDWSPDGQHILVQLVKKHQNQLGLISIVDGSFHLLKKLDDSDPISAKFSPDGHFIAYDLSPNKESDNHDIYTLSIDGKRETKLTSHPSHDYLLDWTPSGKEILFASDRTGTTDMWSISLDEGTALEDPKLVTENIGLIGPLGSTPNGSFYFSTSGSWWDIYTVTVDPETGKVTAPPTEVPLPYQGYNRHSAWSPDGKYLAYVSVRRHLRQPNILCIYSKKTGTIKEFAYQKDVNHPIWFPNSQSILLFGTDVLKIVTGEIKPFIQLKKDEEIYNLIISSDNKYIYYATRNENWEIHSIFSRNLETEKEKELYNTTDDNLTMALSPDGKQLALLSRHNENTRILKIFSTEENSEKIIHKFKQEDFGYINMAWSPDGKNIYFSKKTDSEEKRPWELWRIPSEGGDAENLKVKMYLFIDISIHPDGRNITFTSFVGKEKSGGVWVMENFLPEFKVAKAVIRKEDKAFNIRQVWSGPDVDTYGTPSPDGKYLSYTDWETGDLAIRELATGKTRRLTKKATQKQPAVFALNSVISPDNKLVAYSWTNEYGTYDLCLIGIDGSGNRILYNSRDKDEVYPASWSSDGKQIAARRYSIKGEKAEIISIAVADGSIQVLKTLEKLFLPRLRYSPDDRFIAYDFPVVENSGNHDISLISTDGSGEISLIEHPANDRLLGWTPGRKEILFLSDRLGTWDAWIIQVSNGKPLGAPKRIKPDLGQVSPMAFTQNGSFYFSIYTRRFTTQIAPFDLKTGKVQEQLSRTLLGSNYSAEWSPDGEYLTYVTEHTKPAGPGWYHRPLHVLNLGTGEERELAGDFEVKVPRWSPDGRSILFTGHDNNRRNQKDDDYNGGVYKIDVQDGHVTELLQFPPVQEPIHINFFRDVWWTRSIADWSHDGKDIFYVNRGRIFMRELESGREKQLYQNNNLRRLLDLSPDGKRLVFGTENSDDGTWSILIMPVSGGGSRELCKFHETEESEGIGGGINWTPDGKYVLFTEKTKKGPVLWRISPEGGEPQKLWQLDKGYSGLRIHPDGKQIAFSTYEQDMEIWVMENFLPEETK